ncbi:MAG: hypothetical protein JJE22_09915, partial [Bacteroidia bacterium]|nr:hypothetical protein [Bacteroidia bacterium]
SFLDEPTEIKVITTKDFKKLTDLQTNESLTGAARDPQRSWVQPKNNGTNTFTVNLKPHSFRVFKFE